MKDVIGMMLDAEMKSLREAAAGLTRDEASRGLSDGR